MLFKELRKLSKLAEKRNPMFEQTKSVKYLMYFMALFWAGYLIFFGSLFAFALDDGPVEPYHVMNQGFLFFLLIDVFIRLTWQKTPTQEVKPFLLLPIKRKRIIDFMLTNSGLSTYNLLWLFFFVPFGLFCIVRFYGFLGLLTYSIGVWLLFVINNYWYLLCRILFDKRPWWILLPILVYGALGVAMFVPDESPIYDLSRDLGEMFIYQNPLLAYAGELLVIALLWIANRLVISKVFYEEINRVADTKVKHVFNFNFLDKYGELGEYMRLELKLLTRNKVCRMTLISVSVVVVMFGVLLCNEDIYGTFGRNFFLLYNYVIYAISFFSPIMCYEGNYIDGLMTRKESIYTLLQAKYILYSLGLFIPFLVMLPSELMGSMPIFTSISFAILVAGMVYFLMFQLAVYNKMTISLTKKMVSRQNTVSIQLLLTFAAFGVPILIQYVCKTLFSETFSNIVMTLIGLAFILTYKIWIRNIYQRLMARRYENLEGFRDSREK